jgi:hypothetical protein
VNALLTTLVLRLDWQKLRTVPLECLLAGNDPASRDVDPQRTVKPLERISCLVDGVPLTPTPNVIVTGLTAGTLDFSDRVWTRKLADWVQVRSNLRRASAPPGPGDADPAIT